MLLLLACATRPPPTPEAPVPVPPPVEAPSEPEPPELAPRLFDAAGLAAGLPVGTHIRLRIEADNSPAMVEDWVFVESDPAGCTIHSTTRGAEGEVVADETGRSTWTELESHASFPAAWTTVSDDRVTVPAGTFETRKYVVRDPGDGSVKVLHFAKTLPGPPVRMEVQGPDGTVRMRMTMLVRDLEPVSRASP